MSTNLRCINAVLAKTLLHVFGGEYRLVKEK